jgi:hypothetical protein
MSWDFICVVRDEYKGQRGWGKMYIRNSSDKWEWLCYSYELPWKVFQHGLNAGKSQNNLSRVKFGQYELVPRSDGPKGWRLELQNTGHRSNIQIHRAHRSMFIQGCILPVHFNDRSDDALEKYDMGIQTKSVALMEDIKARYDELSPDKEGNPVLNISAVLPAQIFDKDFASYA